MVKGGEGSGIDVEIGIDLDGGDLEAHSLEKEAGGGGDDSFANARDDTARDEDVLFDHFRKGVSFRLT